MGGANSVALRWDQPRPRAAALPSGVYLPQHAGNHRAQRRTTPRELRPAHWPRPAVAAVARPQPTTSFLQYCTFGLKLAAATLAAATVTLFLTHHEGAQSTNPAPPIATVQMPAAANGSNLYWRPPAPAADLVDPEAGRGTPANYPRSVKTVRFSAPAQQIAAQPAVRPVTAPPQQMAALSPTDPLVAPAARPPVATAPSGNELAGKPLRYLIGGSAGAGHDNEVTMVSYSTSAPVKHGISIAYGNLFDEHNTGRYGPYLHTSDTAAQYGEGQIDPKGPGWEKNLREQYERRKQQGFKYIELDNPDAYKIKDVIGAIDLAATYGLKVIAKNPGITDDAVRYVAHANVAGIIVEKGAGNAAEMDALRRKAGKPDLPVWFVSFGSGRGWGQGVANSAKSYRNMGVTHSSAGEYGNSIDLLTPAEATRSAQAQTR
jgi:hypothetical protein